MNNGGHGGHGGSQQSGGKGKQKHAQVEGNSNAAFQSVGNEILKQGLGHEGQCHSARTADGRQEKGFRENQAKQIARGCPECTAQGEFPLLAGGTG